MAPPTARVVGGQGGAGDRLNGGGCQYSPRPWRGSQFGLRPSPGAHLRGHWQGSHFTLRSCGLWPLPRTLPSPYQDGAQGRSAQGQGLWYQLGLQRPGKGDQGSATTGRGCRSHPTPIQQREDTLGLVLQLLRSETVEVYVNNEINILVSFLSF